MDSARFFDTPTAFRAWLEQHATTAPELLVGFYKVDTGRPSMRWSESVDEALCFGWIDGVRKRVDDAAYTVRFTPRRASSIWSAVNIAKFQSLSAQGRMQPAGAAAFALRSADKSVVYAYEQAQMALLLPEEEQVFMRNKAAWQYWQSCPQGYRKLALHHIVSAKQATTRTARLSKLVAACAAGSRLW